MAKKPVTKSRKVQKTRTNPSTGQSEIYYETESYTTYEDSGSSSSSSYDSGSSSYDSGSSSY